MSVVRLRLLVLALFAVIAAAIWYAAWIESRHALRVAFLDVGQGDAILIESPGGTQVLVDGGRNAAVLRELSAVLPVWDRSIDAIVATHPDADHVGGLPDILERYRVSYVFEPGSSASTSAYRLFEQRIGEEAGAQHLLATRGMRVWLDGAVYLDVLFPDRDMSTAETNYSSIVVRLVYGDTSVLLTGDSPLEVERYLISLDPAVLDSDILKLGHHGSRTSTAPEYLSAVTPDVAIVSAGRDNSYGHPHETVLENLRAAGVPWLATFEHGQIVYESDGKTFERVK